MSLGQASATIPRPVWRSCRAAEARGLLMPVPTSIYASILRLVLAELPAHPLLRPSASSPCLADALSPYLSRHPGKRKRSITHFEGIPVSMLSDGCGSPASSAASTPLQTPEREIRGTRRAMCLSDYFAGLGVEKRVRFVDAQPDASEAEDYEPDSDDEWDIRV